MTKRRKVNPNAIKEFLNASDNAGTTTGITEANFTSKLASSLNYYQRNYNGKDAKEFLIKFRPDVSKFIIGISETQFHPFLTLGFTCKFFLDNQIPISFHTETEKWINEKVEEIKTLKASKKIVVEGEKPKHDIQKAINNQIRDKIGDIDNYFDTFIVKGKVEEFDIIEYLKKINLSPLHLRKIYNIYLGQKNDIISITEDKDLKEGYSFLSPSRISKIIKFYDTNLEKIDSYIKSNSSRRSSVVKKPSIKKMVLNVKYAKDNKELGITSLSPDKILGNTIIFLYNVKTRKLTYLKANDVSGFGIKGTTIQNYNEKNSFCKAVRYSVDLKLFVTSNKTTVLDMFNKLTTKSSIGNGRINSDTLILSVFK